MAERTVTVNINYKVNTTAVQQGEQAVNRAQQATDKLRQSTEQLGQSSKKAGDQATSSNRTWGTSIEGLRVRQQQLATTISLTSKENVSRLKELSAEYKKVSAEVKKLEDQYLKLKTAQNESNTSTDQGIQGFLGLINAARSFIAIGLAREIIQISTSMATLSGIAEGVGRAFTAQIPNAKIYLETLRQATHNTLDDVKLMQLALQAKNFGIDLDSLPKFFEFAATRAQQTGVSVDYLVDSIVRGIGKKSLLVLDNLQINVSELKEEFKGVGIQSLSVGEISQAVSKILEKETKKMGGYINNTATEVDKLNAKFKSLQTQVATTFTSTAGGQLNESLQFQVSALELLFKSINQGQTPYKTLYEDTKTYIVAARESMFVQQKLVGTTAERIQALTYERGAINATIGVIQFQIKQQEKLQESLKEQYSQNRTRAIEKQLDDNKRLIEANKLELAINMDLAKAYGIRLENLKALNVPQNELVGLIAKQREVVKGLQEDQANAKTEDEIAKIRARIDAEDEELKRLLALGEQTGIISRLQDKIKELNKQQPLANSRAEILRLNLAIEATQAELNDLINLGKPLNKMFSDIRKNLDKKQIIEGLFPKDSNAIKGAADKLSKNYVDNIKDGIDLQLRAAANGDLNINIPVTGTIPSDFFDDLTDEFNDKKNDLISTGIFNLTDVITAGFQAEADLYDQRLSHLKDYYDTQMIYAGDNEKAKDRLRQQEQKKELQLRKEAFEADKEAKRKTTIVNGAAAIINAFATLPYPAAIVASLAIAATTAAQLAIINKQQPRFKDGVLNLKGPGTSTSDSIHARLSKGESVMTANETKGSYQILKAVRGGRLNDQVMREIVQGTSGGRQFIGQTFDATPIVNELRELRKNQPNYANEYGILYETRRYSDTLKKKVRSKSMTI